MTTQDHPATSPPNSVMERRIRFSAILLIIGLLIEAVSLKWAHPTAFLVFAFVGAAFMCIGSLIFLYSLVNNER